MSPFPPLLPCGGSGDCPHDALISALQALRTKLAAACTSCVTYVFGKVGSPSDQKVFSAFVARRAGLYDGTRSSLPMQAFSGDMATQFELGFYTQYLATGTTVKNVFDANKDIAALAYPQYTAAHNPSSTQGLVIFFRPSKTCTDSSVASCFAQNEARLFHEGLHEFYDISDNHTGLQELFKIPVIPCTGDITDYIAFNVFNVATQSCIP
jgi:hypothetical protein